ncbi:SpoIIE family protein phosphatase [Desulfococcaceae bacterium HSG9]|nr:SpoIIE family protein phosphatase [Desulfococcaceae bacterium HSG9]
MVAHKPKRLSLLLGLYLLISIVGFSTGVLVWAYYSSIQAINQELGNSFDQKHTLAESIMERELEFIEQTLLEIRESESFLLQVFQKSQVGTENILNEILDSDTERQLDILFVTLAKGSLLSNVSSPFFDTEIVLPKISEHKTALLSSGQVLRFKKESVDLTIMLKAAPIIQKNSGRVLGTLFGGIVLNNNLSILEAIKRKTKSKLVVFIENNNIIGSTDLLEAPTTQTVRKLTHDYREGDIYSGNGLLANHKHLSLFGQSTSLKITTAITDQILIDLQHSYLKKGSVLLVFSFVFLMFTALIIRKFTFPSLKKLLNYSADVSTGNLQARYIPGSITEFNRLGQAIEQMVKTIRDEIEERRLVEADRVRLTTIMETTSDLVSMSTSEAKVIYMNHAGREMVGWLDDKNLTTKQIHDVHPQWALQIVEKEGIPVAIEHGAWEGETAVLGPDGSEIPVSQVIMSHKSEEGELEYLSTIMRDITERLRAEKVESNAKLLAQEMELARSIQTGLLPSSVSNVHPDFIIAASMLTAERVGGDYFDITFDKQGNLWISIGDVSGHGVKPGLIMMMAQTVHAAVISSMNCEARDVVIRTNDILYRNVHNRLNEKHFMTFNALKCLGDGRFEHAGAHLRIIVYRLKSDLCELIRTKGVYLNLKENISKSTKNSYFEMEEGDVMVLYTDGLTEAENPDGEMLDIGGFTDIVKKHAHLQPKAMKDMILADVIRWCDNKRNDDMTLVVVKRKGGSDG